MKCIVVFLTLLVAIWSKTLPDQNEDQEDMEFFLYEDKHGEIHVEHLVNVPVNLTSTASDVIYHFYSKSNPVRSVEIHSDYVEALKNTAFTPNKETIFIIHGWKNSYESDMNSHIREFILRDHDINVFVVDWGLIAEKNYVSAQGSVRRVGEYVASFALSLRSIFDLQLSRLKFVGHSLGAHISGCAGAVLNGQVDRIVGLDPAGPLFKDHNKDNRIDDSDAVTVQIIHTNGGKLGYMGLCGDSDYYPNGGKSQPGCGWEVSGSCSHSRAYELYAESLTSTSFVAQKCDDYSEYTSGKCRGHKSSMGMFNIDTGSTGAYYLETNKEPPYAKG